MKHAIPPFLLGLLAGLVPAARAHTIFTTLYVDDVSQGDGTCVRMSRSPDHCTDPISSIDSEDMACGVNGDQAVAFTCPAPAGGKLTFQWRLWANAEQPGVIDESHKGPCAIYAKQLDDMSTGSAAGPGWIKLWDEGYDEEAGLWCTEKLIETDGLLSFRIPTTLPPGNWLFRPELLALQNVVENDPQFYVGCAQVFVEGPAAASGGGWAEEAGKSAVSIPGHVSADDPGLTFDIYAPRLALPYQIPGPAVFAPSDSPSSSSASAKAAKVVQQAEGAVPADFLIKNANWVGVELPPYNTENGCWDAAAACWEQADACYDDAPPSGNENCRVWESKCEGINDACEAGNYQGPPDLGARLESQEPPVPAGIPKPVNEGEW